MGTAEYPASSKAPTERSVGALASWRRFVAWDSESLRRQESILISLNLCALVILLVLHILFTPVLGAFPAVAVGLFAARIIMQSIELAILNSDHAPVASTSVFCYYNMSMWVHLGFAFVVSVASGLEDAHYTALMAIPIIAAGFRFSLMGLTSVVFVSATLMTIEIIVYYNFHPPAKMIHFFEVATIESALLVVGFVIWCLANHMREREQLLADTLTELSTAQDKLVAEEKLAAIGRLSNAITHEIRNPVSMIASSLALAARPDSSPEVKEKMSAIAARESARLADLTADFLGYANSKAPDKKKTSVSRSLRFVADTAQAQTKERGIRITVDTGPESTACFDEGQIHQGLLNLITNAIDFTSEGGEILLGEEPRSDGEVRLFVENSGDAINDTDLAHVFEPFFTTKDTGTGMGLAITQNIARNHGGDLVLAVNQPGRVRFCMALPINNGASDSSE